MRGFPVLTVICLLALFGGIYLRNWDLVYGVVIAAVVLAIVD